jgi:hypothetical protein
MLRIAFVIVIATAWIAGCSKSPESAPGTGAAASSAAPIEVAPPDVAVRQFLEAIRIGDHKQAEAMLTAVARQKTMEMDLLVAPPGSPTANFTIAGVEVIENQVAHVGCVWTDTGDNGKPQTNEFVWALRRQPEGWRVAGVAVQLFPNQPPVLLDFEDPADMVRKQQMAEAEFGKQQTSQNVQAGGATGTPGSTAVLPAGATMTNTIPSAGAAPNAVLQGSVPTPDQSTR